MISILLLLIVAAFVMTLFSAAGKVPLWVPVLLLCIVALFQVLPIK